ncbi:MAG: M3 family oligoendopeptidase [Bacteroidota bacterium]|nr:M3 family oligoendopeptidase [Bacteroidota bacterium]MDP4214667.1 M3 family oligoendopeptidase [Bacteroidota bacterium]MDP4244362.1 M3 family oligoendopeptidase [Bacteroidota bacterium]MDP4255699.1 M3 family oligoendopeptidase [Bacteroidota bacterium]MDP4258924.1 M3 family oligoendopeptidase [Bacteroidota bacterium]
MMNTAELQRPERHFLPENFTITNWEALEPWFINLEQRNLGSREALEHWLRDMSELESVISEDACWRQIRMTCDTENKALEEAFTYFCMEIQPRMQPYADRLNRMLIDCPYTRDLDQKRYFTYLRAVKKKIELFREANIPLQAELSVLAQQYGVICGKMTVRVNDREYTLQQASKFLESPDRALREEVYTKIQERRIQDKDALNDLYSQLLAKRHQMALNAGFSNYRDYKFEELGRFDYTKEDCYRFHEAVRESVLPLVNTINENKRKKLGLDTLRPWDAEAEPAGVEPLRPFSSGEELVTKTIACFDRLNPFFGDCLRTMKAMGRFDLDSRKGKAPGGYNCPLAETGAPFIFMNASGQMGDLTTMVHEGGHAIHSFLTHPLELNAFKEYPMEIAEVASMTMELFSMDHWDLFFSDKNDLARAREHQLERVISIFPWIATIDKFQHWIYENPSHSLQDREDHWMEILQEFSSSAMDWSGLEKFRTFGWQRQLHLFEVPFYYIEYGIAQLGAIGLWKQYKENKEKALSNYTAALSLGGTRTLPELYDAARLKFNFSKEHIKNLMEFVRAEMEKGPS